MALDDKNLYGCFVVKILKEGDFSVNCENVSVRLRSVEILPTSVYEKGLGVSAG